MIDINLNTVNSETSAINIINAPVETNASANKNTKKIVIRADYWEMSHLKFIQWMHSYFFQDIRIKIPLVFCSLQPS